jgi:class 3 adenylate cyclase
VFQRTADAAALAVRLRDLARNEDWRSLGLPKDITVRIGLHAGLLYRCFDAVLRKRVFVGASVTRTARIEPIVEQGQIFATAPFAALAAVEGAGEFEFDYVGVRELPKAGGRTPLFLLRRVLHR